MMVMECDCSVTPSLDSCDRLRDAFDGIAASVDVVEFCNLKRLGTR